MRVGWGGSKLEHYIINSIIFQTSQSLLMRDKRVVALRTVGDLKSGSWRSSSTTTLPGTLRAPRHSVNTRCQQPARTINT